MPRKLLLADDSVTIQRVIELTFADEDVDVVTAGDGQQAIDRIETERPDIVLADVGMPERDGYDVAAFVKRTPHLAHIPVILLTGAFERVDEERARAVGCDGVLAKPFEPQVVINQVRELLSRRRSTEPARTAEPSWARTAPPAAGPGPRPVERPFEGPPAGFAAEAPSNDSLDAYFDRLDAAFANLGAAPIRHEVGDEELPLRGREADVSSDGADLDQSVAEMEHIEARARTAAPPIPFAPIERQPSPTELEIGRPEEGNSLGRSIERPRQPVEPSGAAAPPSPQLAPATFAGPPHTAAAAPPLADAFAALLAAEQQQPAPTSGASPSAAGSAVVTDALVEQVTRRVLEGISERLIRETVTEVVLSVADRLVREEIERIKSEVR